MMFSRWSYLRNKRCQIIRRSLKTEPRLLNPIQSLLCAPLPALGTSQQVPIQWVRVFFHLSVTCLTAIPQKTTRSQNVYWIRTKILGFMPTTVVLAFVTARLRAKEATNAPERLAKDVRAEPNTRPQKLQEKHLVGSSTQLQKFWWLGNFWLPTQSIWCFARLLDRCILLQNLFIRETKVGWVCSQPIGGIFSIWGTISLSCDFRPKSGHKGYCGKLVVTYWRSGFAKTLRVDTALLPDPWSQHTHARKASRSEEL